MDLKFAPHLGIGIYPPKTEYKADQLELKLSCNKTGGNKSKCIALSIDFNGENLSDNPAIVWIEFNRNEARYLVAGLTAFINEEDLDPNDED